MKKPLLDCLSRPGAEHLSALLCLTVSFSVGAVCGCLFAGLLGANVQMHLFGYLDSYFALLHGGEPVHSSLLTAAWELLRWPLLVFALGFTVLGVVGLPVTFCARGFLLSYAVSVLVRIYGGVGLITALSVFGISGFWVLPAMFTLGVDAFRHACALSGRSFGEARRAVPLGRARLLRVCACCAALLVGIFLQVRLMPVLLKAAAGLIG